VDPAQVQRDADIALRQQRQRDADAREREAQRLKAEQDRKRKEAQEQAERDRKAAEAERRKAEQAQQARKDAQAERDRKAAEAAAAAERAKARAEQMQRIQGLAGASGGPTSTGTALANAGPSASYAGRIQAAVRPNITFAETVSGNPVAEVEVRTLPDGTVASARIVKSSGLPAWDQAVLRALEKTARLPRNEDGRVPSPLLLGFRPKD
jgi:colicin import membrane protein